VGDLTRQPCQLVLRLGSVERIDGFGCGLALRHIEGPFSG
jgi:hypothetical protein